MRKSIWNPDARVAAGLYGAAPARRNSASFILDARRQHAKGRPPWAALSLSSLALVLLQHDFDATVLRLTHTVRRRDQQPLLAAANDRDRGGRHAVLHEGVLDRIGAAQRQRHVVVLRARGV